MSMWRDARGAPLELRPLTPEPAGDARYRALQRRRAAWRAAPPTGCVACLAGAAMGGLFLCASALYFLHLDTRLALMLTLLSLVGGMGLLVIILESLPGRRWWRARVSKLAAKLRLCVACGYDLDGLESAPDGCIVCPECGAAWRLPLTDPAPDR